ncbi:MAG: hypothetical protein DRR19_28995 [Candidatus Parabeggiatoa sp. nov. 1]|nr:MAG: hypothetical protein DRR19_28995 [Gammaproteobacteria bacterium]
MHRLYSRPKQGTINNIAYLQQARCLPKPNVRATKNGFWLGCLLSVKKWNTVYTVYTHNSIYNILAFVVFSPISEKVAHIVYLLGLKNHTRFFL